MTNTRFWMFTSFITEGDLWDSNTMSYLIYQLEKCPRTHRLHIQGYVEFKQKISLSTARLYLPHGAHLEQRKGTQKEAIDYCSKEETKVEGPLEFGTMSEGQGTRNDINNAIQAIKDGGSIQDLIENYPVTFCKYIKGLLYIKNMYELKNKTWRDIYVAVYWGDAGTGKTKSVYEKETYNNVYKLNASTQSIWFDGYDGEDVLLIDDFNGWIPFKFMLNILDGYPLNLPIKGGQAFAKWTKVYITSNSHWLEWYENIEPKDQVALKRRIKITQEFTRSMGPS